MKPDEPDFRKQYEEAMRTAYEEGAAVVAEAVRKAEARRRFHVDPNGRTTVAYVDAVEEDRKP